MRLHREMKVKIFITVLNHPVDPNAPAEASTEEVKTPTSTPPPVKATAVTAGELCLKNDE